MSLLTTSSSNDPAYTITSVGNAASIASLFEPITQTPAQPATSSSPEQLSSISSMQASFISAVSEGAKTASTSSRNSSSTMSSQSNGTPVSSISNQTSLETTHTPIATNLAKAGPREVPSAIIAGVSIGVIAGCVVLVLVVLFCVRRRLRKNRTGIKTAPAVNLFAGKAELEAKALQPTISKRPLAEHASERELATQSNRHELEA